jgi:hypothetical protein
MDLSAFTHGARFYDSQLGLFCTVRHIRLEVPKEDTKTWDTATIMRNWKSLIYVCIDYDGQDASDINLLRCGDPGPASLMLGCWKNKALVPLSDTDTKVPHLMATQSR